MTTPLWDIAKHKRTQYDNRSLAVDWSLQDYYNMAERCIGKFASRSLSRCMLCSEDAVSFVAEYLMYAAYRWDETRGCSIKTYLNKCAIWSIHRWVTMQRATPNLWSLNVECGERGEQCHEMVPSPEKPPHSHARILKIIDKGRLTKRQRYCMEAVYVHDLTQKELASRLGVSRQAVSKCIQSAIQKIRVSLKSHEFI